MSNNVSELHKVLVCGGRDFKNYKLLCESLDTYHGPDKCIGTIVHGAARGADSLAGQWAKDNNVPVEVYPAKWDVHGRAAGMIRNREMLDTSKADIVIAFPGGVGTAGMKSYARSKDVPVVEIDDNNKI
jgi:hypothetical protein